MVKNAQEMTNDILKALNKKDAPEAILIETYLEVMVTRIKKEAVNEYIANQKKANDVEYKPSHG